MSITINYMASLSRRKVLGVISVIWVSLGTGCMAFGNEDGIDVIVRNEDTRSHRFELVITGDFHHVHRAMKLDAGERILFDELIPDLDYEHEIIVWVAIDREPVISTTTKMDEDGPYTIIIQDDKTASIQY